MDDEVAREDEGGESACFAHLTCPECGVLLDGAGHSLQCHWERESLFDATNPPSNA
jgi:hypothetical protein